MDGILLYFNKLFSFLERDWSESNRFEAGKPPKSDNVNRIVFDTVSFTYPNGVRALRNVSFEVSRGETLAIVGENGAGKTTIAKLICGFFKPTGGTIQIAGADTPNLDVESVRHTTGAVFQDYAKYPWTLRENVLLNGRTGPDADQRIDAAFLRVGLDLQVPYDRTLGRTYGGIEPSGGQWQKIAIARVLVRDPSLMILDEPSAALDPLSEAQVYELFDRILDGRIGIVITHRLGSIRFADRILVLKGGSVVGIGDHDSLMRAGGYYRELYLTQSRNYVRNGPVNRTHS